MKRVLVILGPTGVGKSGVAIELAKRFNGEIVSVDSVQIYKRFNIGSAKITQEQMQGIKHYGIDILEPIENFSVYDYVQFALKTIEDISQRGKLPILVGGTALYVKALTENFNLGGTERNDQFRKEATKELEEFGPHYILEKIKALNPQLAIGLDLNNTPRLLRALEIAKFGKGKEKEANKKEYDYKIFALTLERQALYNKINLRVEQMIDEGLIDEVKSILKDYGKSAVPLKAIGYKEVVSYLMDEIDLQTMKEKIKQNTRHYAKRQFTFLKTMKNINYIDMQDREEGLDKIIEEVIKWHS